MTDLAVSGPTTSIDAAHADTLLSEAYALLTDIETVLVHASPDARDEVTKTLAGHTNNQGGYGLLIDLVQLNQAAIGRYLNNR